MIEFPNEQMSVSGNRLVVAQGKENYTGSYRPLVVESEREIRSISGSLGCDTEDTTQSDDKGRC